MQETPNQKLALTRGMKACEVNCVGKAALAHRSSEQH